METVTKERIIEDEEMLSFDETAIYTSLPIGRAIQSVREHLEEDCKLDCPTLLSVDEILRLPEICLRSTFFPFQDKFYCLKDGVAMGSPISSLVANILMQSFEQRVLSKAGDLAPRVWKR